MTAGVHNIPCAPTPVQPYQHVYERPRSDLASDQRILLELNPIFSRQFDENPKFRLSVFEFFSASRKETVKTAGHTQDNDREVFVPHDSWPVRNSFGQIDNVTPSPTQQFSAPIYLDSPDQSEMFRRLYDAGAAALHRRAEPKTASCRRRHPFVQN
jgi:hypothetical protein